MFAGFKESTATRPVVSPEALDAWHAGAHAGTATDARMRAQARAGVKKGRRVDVSTCVSDKWVVITSIFAPSELIGQLATMEGWCTVVVADKKTPVGEWREHAHATSRVKLLTTAEQTAIGYRVVDMLPWNHFGRKNIGFLYAIRNGAEFIYDTDDDNILKVDGSGRTHIPLVHTYIHGDMHTDAATRVGPAAQAVAQAFHCAFSSGVNRTWNPYVLFGQPSSWPRGIPLDDITLTQAPCREGKALAASAQLSTPEDSAYRTAYQDLPGIAFAVQQSLADVHPDIDAIHRLTRRPLTFDFVRETPHAAVYGPDRVYSPYNAQATLHTYDAFWSLLLPITVHGRVSDIWRSYFAQRLMWRYGLRVAFIRPFVNQDRTPHNYLKDFQSEDQLYMRAGALVDFLESWQPSDPHAALPAQHEELLVALYEHDILGEHDVLVGQAWLADLQEAGYEWPSFKTHGLYDAWTSRHGSGAVVLLPAASDAALAKKAMAKAAERVVAVTKPGDVVVMLFEHSADSSAQSAWMDDGVRKSAREALSGRATEFHGVRCLRDGEGSSLCSGPAAGFAPACHAAVRRLTSACLIDASTSSDDCVPIPAC